MFTRKKSSQRLRTCTRCLTSGLPRLWRTCSAMTEWSASRVSCFSWLESSRFCVVDIVKPLPFSGRLEGRMVGEQLQRRFGILPREVIESDWANGEPDGTSELPRLAPALYLVNPIRANRLALNKYRVLHDSSPWLTLTTGSVRTFKTFSVRPRRATSAIHHCWKCILYCGRSCPRRTGCI